MLSSADGSASLKGSYLDPPHRDLLYAGLTHTLFIVVESCSINETISSVNKKLAGHELGFLVVGGCRVGVGAGWWFGKILNEYQ